MSEPISWKAIDDKARNILVHEKVMGKSAYCTGDVQYLPDHGCFECYECRATLPLMADETQPHVIAHLPQYTTSMDAAWRIVEKMVKRMGYDHLGFEWTGSLYKPIHHYFSSCQHDEIHKTGHFDYTLAGGFSLGEPCWYVKYSSSEPPSVLRGRYNWIMTDTPQEAICIAALRIEDVEVLP